MAAALAAKWTADKKAKLADKGFFKGWGGEGALGGSFLTGNTDQKGFSTSLGLEKRNERWGHAGRENTDTITRASIVYDF